MSLDQLEALNSEYSKIAEQLKKLEEEIKKENDEKIIKEKREEAKKLKHEAFDKKDEIIKGIKEIKKGDDDDAKNKAKDIEATINQTTKDIESLLTSIMTIKTDTSGTTSGTETTDNKNIFKKGWGWVGKQWKDVWSKDSWEKSTGKNILRTVGFAATGVGAAALAYKGVKKLFGRGKDKKEGESKESSKKKKKPFFDRWYGKALKWAAITAGGIFGINWLGKKLDLRGVDKDKPTDDESPKVKYEAFDKLPEEVKETYNLLGDNVDVVYNKINKRELDAGYNDEISLDRIAKTVGGRLDNTGVIPFCLDNKYGSVENLLTQNHDLKFVMQGTVREMVDWLKNKGRDILEHFAKDYLKNSGFPFSETMGDKLADKIVERANNDAERQEEIKLFFRQSIRIEKYFFEKKKQLEEYLLEHNGIGKTKEEIMKDDELYETYVGNHPDYKSFMTGGIHAASKVLKEKGLLNDEIGEDTKNTVSNLDKERDAITGNSENDIAKIITEKKDTITNDEKNKLKESCKKMQNDIRETIVPALEHSSIRIRQDLLKESNDTEIKKYIEDGGLQKQLSKYGEIINNLGEKIDTLNDAEIKRLAQNLNNLLAIKKEIILGAETIGDEDINFGFRLVTFIGASLNQELEGIKKIFRGEIIESLTDMAFAMPGSLAGAGCIMVTIGGVTYVFGGKSGKIIGKSIAITGLKSIGATIYLPYLAARLAGRGASRLYRRVKGKYTPPDLSDERILNSFIDDIKAGRKTLSEASDDVISNIMKGNDDKVNKLIKEFNLDAKSSNDPLHIKKKLLDKAFSDSESLKNLKGNPELYKRAVKYFDSCGEVKNYIKNNEGNLDDLEKAIDSHEKRIAPKQLKNTTPDTFSKTCEDAWNRSSLKNEFDSKRTELEKTETNKTNAKNTAEEKLNKAKDSQQKAKIAKDEADNKLKRGEIDINEYQKAEKAFKDAEAELKTAEDHLKTSSRELNKVKKEIKELNNCEKEIKTAMKELEEGKPRNIAAALDNLLGDTHKAVKTLMTAGSSDLIHTMKNVKKLEDLVGKLTDKRYGIKNLDDLIENLNGKFIDGLLDDHIITSKAVANELKKLAEEISHIRLRGSSLGIVNDTMKVLKNVFRLAKAL